MTGYPPAPGSAARVRTWWAGVVAGREPGVPDAFLSKLRLVETFLGPLGRLLGLGPVRSIADLLPETDEAMGAMLHLIHDWSGAMLAVDGEARRVLPAATEPVTEP